MIPNFFDTESEIIQKMEMFRNRNVTPWLGLGRALGGGAGGHRRLRDGQRLLGAEQSERYGHGADPADNKDGRIPGKSRRVRAKPAPLLDLRENDAICKQLARVPEPVL